MPRPTVRDIAAKAGVSLATVDRVMNARSGVRPDTVARVNDAIAALGYRRDMAAANLARRRQDRLTVLLPEAPSLFLQSLRAAVVEAAGDAMTDRADVTVETLPLQDPDRLQRQLAALRADPPDGVAVMAPQSAAISAALGQLAERGCAVVTLVTDQPTDMRQRFVGIDNFAAGRTAGVLMGRFLGGRTGPVGVVVSSLQARDMTDRLAGFTERLSRFEGLEVLPALEGHDDHTKVAALVADWLSRTPETAGLYCAGAGTRGVIGALKALGRPPGLCVICHEATPATRGALQDGTIDAVIAQNTGHIARSAIRVLKAQLSGTPVIASQEQIRIEILLAENLVD